MYAKLFQQVLASSLTEKEPLEVRGLFFMLMAAADKDGVVLGSDSRIAQLLNVPMDQFSRCLSALMLPDPHSGNPDFEGRRVVRLESRPGLFLPSYQRYSGIQTDAQRREYNRIKKAESRARLNGNNETPVSPPTDPNTIPVNPPADPIPEPTKHWAAATSCLEFYNRTTGSEVPMADPNSVQLIAEALAIPGVTLDGVKAMIERKTLELRGTKDAKYLGLRWLFGKQNFGTNYGDKSKPIVIETKPKSKKPIGFNYQLEYEHK